MPEIPFDGVIKEMKAKPYTMLVIVGLCLAVSYLWRNDARAEDVEQLTAQVTQINVTLIEAELQRIEAQLFDIQAKIADKVAAHQAVDTIYTDKVQELTAKKAHTERVLASLSK